MARDYNFWILFVTNRNHSVLYNTSFLVTSDVGEGGPHNHDNMPVLLAGNGGGAEDERTLAHPPSTLSLRGAGMSGVLAQAEWRIAVGDQQECVGIHP